MHITPGKPSGSFSATVLNTNPTPEDAPVLAWFFQHCTHMAHEGLADWLNMPYGQGGGEFILAKLHNRPEAPAWAEPTLKEVYEHPTDGPLQVEYNTCLVPGTEGPLTFTGWVFMDAYTDSMTSLYASAVFRTEAGTYVIHDI